MPFARMPEPYCLRLKKALENGKMVTVVQKHRIQDNVTIDGRGFKHSDNQMKKLEESILYKESREEVRKLKDDFDPKCLPKCQILADRAVRACLCGRKNGLQDDCMSRLKVVDHETLRKQSYPKGKIYPQQRLSNKPPERLLTELSTASMKALSSKSKSVINITRDDNERTPSLMSIKCDRGGKMTRTQVHNKERTMKSSAINESKGLDKNQDLPDARYTIKDSCLEEIDAPYSHKYGIICDRLVLKCSCSRSNGLQDFCDERICIKTIKGERKTKENLLLDEIAHGKCHTANGGRTGIRGEGDGKEGLERFPCSETSETRLEEIASPDQILPGEEVDENFNENVTVFPSPTKVKPILVDEERFLSKSMKDNYIFKEDEVCDMTPDNTEKKTTTAVEEVNNNNESSFLQECSLDLNKCVSHPNLTEGNSTSVREIPKPIVYYEAEALEKDCLKEEKRNTVGKGGYSNEMASAEPMLEEKYCKVYVPCEWIPDTLEQVPVIKVQ